jgi:hypothetical protein
MVQKGVGNRFIVGPEREMLATAFAKSGFGQLF